MRGYGQVRRDFRRGALAALLALAALSLAFARQAAEGGAKPAIRQLAWIAGGWVQDSPKARTEEHWTDVAGNMMLGVGRTIVGGKTVFFEFLRIEERADGIYYVAQPKGRPGTDFRLTRLEGQEAVFENPAHDFPKRIVYRRNADGSITARVDGGAESPKAEEFHYRPLPK